LTFKKQKNNAKDLFKEIELNVLHDKAYNIIICIEKQVKRL